jgi:hypothetical protein
MEPLDLGPFRRGVVRDQLQPVGARSKISLRRKPYVALQHPVVRVAYLRAQMLEVPA